jgi:hypothetical protein
MQLSSIASRWSSRTTSRIAARAARSVAMFGVALLAACGGDDKSPAGPGDQVTGTYTLRTVAGRPVPAVLVEEDGVKLEVVSGALTLNGDGRFAGTMTLRVTENGTVTTETDGGGGRYTVDGGSLVLTDEEGERTTATRAGNSITLSDGGIAMVFTR